MDLVPLVSVALADDFKAFAELKKVPAGEWTKQAPQLAVVFAQFFERFPKPQWPQLGALRRVAGLPAMADVVRLLLEPSSEHAALGLKLAAAGNPNDELEARLRELEPSDEVRRALQTASGAGIVEGLAHWMGKPYVSQDVLDAMAAPLSDLATLAPRQVARHAPQLIDLMENWQSVTGGDNAIEQVYRALDRSHLPTLIKTLEPLVAKDRHRWLAMLKDIFFRWPSGAKWAENAIEYFEPSEDESEEEDGGEAPQPVQAFRRQR